MPTPTIKRKRDFQAEDTDASKFCSGGCGSARAGGGGFKAGMAINADSIGIRMRAPLETRSLNGWQCDNCTKLIGATVIARRGRSFEDAVVVQCDSGGLIRVRWEPSDNVASLRVDAPEMEWVAERHAALAVEPAEDTHYRRGTRVLAQWVDGRFYYATIQGQAAHKRLSIEFEDGLRFQLDASCIRSLLDKPLVTPPPRGLSGGFGRGERSGGASHRLLTGGTWDISTLGSNRTGARGPLAQAMSELEAVWRRSGTWEVEYEVAGIRGLLVCRDFLSVDEVSPHPALPQSRQHRGCDKPDWVWPACLPFWSHLATNRLPLHVIRIRG